MSERAAALAAIDRLVDRGGDADDVLRAVLAALHDHGITFVAIRFAGREIGGLPPHRIINLGIGRTFQIPRPFRRLSLLDNVVLAGFFGQGRASRTAAFTAAEQALTLVGLPTDRAATVDGLGAAALKKLELAKALATGPRLLLADESLSGLDETEMDQAADLLGDKKKCSLESEFFE